MSSKNQKRQRLIVFIFVNAIQYPRTLKSNICHSNKWGPLLFLHLGTNPVTDRALVNSVSKTHVLVVTVDLIWLLFLNILSFNVVAAPRKSLRFTRFIRSYVNHPGVVLTNHCQSYTAFLLDVRCSKLPCSKYTCCSNVVNSKVGRETNRCEIVINISNLTVGLKHSINQRTTFSPNLHSVEEESVCPFYSISIMVFPLHI